MDVEIFLHNELAQTPIYPDIISLFCENSAQEWGDTSICRTDFLFKNLFESQPEQCNKLEQLGIK